MDVTLDQPQSTRDLVSIDKEHQVQIGMLDAFCTLIVDNEPQTKIHEMLNQLTSFSEVHFMSEQLLMRMYAYPEYDDHVNDHETMTEHLNQIKQSYTTGEKNMALETANEMKKFLLGHISSRDQAFTNYLTNMQKT
ncbi:bacteriohemerythrin [Kaarinaea lacus]